MPEMIFLIAVTVVLPLSVLALLFSYQKTRLRAKQSASDNELTTSELRGIIDEAVVEATVELEERVAALEQQVRLIGPSSERASDAAAGSKTLGTLTRE